VIVLPGIVPYIGSTEEEARALARQFDELRVPEYGLRQLAAVFETEPSVFELDEPLPDFILARPKLEGSQSRSDLIIDLAVREQLTVRQIISRLGGGRGHFEFVGTPEQIAEKMRGFTKLGVELFMLQHFLQDDRAGLQLLSSVLPMIA
jgi:alkanesulfonate monooxygenase SsuD/methylene tetrahydromethanopterin reductase-like flavin-dependent oxidoreductase (luciferase family)